MCSVYVYIKLARECQDFPVFLHSCKLCALLNINYSLTLLYVQCWFTPKYYFTGVNQHHLVPVSSNKWAIYPSNSCRKNGNRSHFFQQQGYRLQIFVLVHSWGGGVLPEKLGRGVRPASQIPYPIYDQNLQFSLPPDQKFDTLFMTWLLDHWGKGFDCWPYLACVAGVKRCKGRQSADGRRKTWWKSSFFKKNELKTKKIDTLFMTKMVAKWLKSIPIWPKWLKTIPFGATHTHIVHIHCKGVPPGFVELIIQNAFFFTKGDF